MDFRRLSVRIFGALRAMGADLALVVFPATCHACGEIVDEGPWAPLLCTDCGASFPFHDRELRVPGPLAAGAALARFEGPARRLLIDLKFNGLVRAGRLVGRAMGASRRAGKLLEGADLVVPVPLHWFRRWRRGHNQAAVLARALCRAQGTPRFAAALRRARATRAQVGRDRAERARNVAGAFRVRRRHQAAIEGRAVVLVDDVVTTGATAAAAAEALLAGGAREVRLYAAAWSP